MVCLSHVVVSPCRVKYTGLLGLGCIGLLTICDLWQLIADPTLDLVSGDVTTTRVVEYFMSYEID